MQADNTQTPSAPDIYPAYRAFYIVPSDNLSSSIVRIDFFVARSNDDINWGTPQFLQSGDSTSGRYAVHSELSENVYYAYYCQYIYSDGSKSPIGTIAEAGHAELIANSNLNIDQLAAEAYTTGLVTAGTFRGVIFETSATNPKVRMDPTGIFATTSQGTKIFSLDAASGNITLQSSGLSTPLITGATIQTSATNPKVVLDASGLWINDAGGNKALSLNYSEGLDLVAGISGLNAVRWFQGPTVDTPCLGQIFSATSGSFDVSGEFSINDPGDVFQSTAFRLFTSTFSETGNAISATTHNIGHSTAYDATIINGLGQSTFVQLGGADRVFASWGVVQTGTSTVVKVGSNDWTVAAFGTGALVTLTSAPGGDLIVTATVVAITGPPSALFTAIDLANPGQFVVYAFDITGTALANINVAFTAYIT